MSDKLDRWIGHMDHLARRIEFVSGCWVCEMGDTAAKRYPVKKFITSALTGAVIGLAIGTLSGCAPKKTVQPIRGPAIAHYKLSDCKPLPRYEPGLDCSRVQLVPVTLPAK